MSMLDYALLAAALLLDCKYFAPFRLEWCEIFHIGSRVVVIGDDGNVYVVDALVKERIRRGMFEYVCCFRSSTVAVALTGGANEAV